MPENNENTNLQLPTEYRKYALMYFLFPKAFELLFYTYRILLNSYLLRLNVNDAKSSLTRRSATIRKP